MTVNQVRGQTYSIHLTCTYVQGGSGVSDIVVTVVTPAKIQWRSIDPAGETTYRFCGSR